MKRNTLLVAALSVLLILGVRVAHSVTPPLNDAIIPEEEAVIILGSTSVQTSLIAPKVFGTECEECPDPYFPPQPSPYPVPATTYVGGNPEIDLIDWDVAGRESLGYSVDYAIDSPLHDCATCSPGTAECSSTLRLERRFAPNNTQTYSSLGPAYFWNYDSKIFLDEDATGQVISYFDAERVMMVRLTDDGGGDPIDGVFVDDETRSLKKLELLDAAGNLVTDYASAAAARITKHHGETLLFEIIDFDPDTQNEEWAGRLTQVADRTGHTLSVTYRDALPAASGGFTSQELIDSPERHWQIHTISDDVGVAATVYYDALQHSGCWCVDYVDVGALTVADYAYTDGLLTDVAYVDGSTATISYDTDPAAQTATIFISDPAMQCAMTDATYHVSADYMELTVQEQEEIINQPAGVLRMVLNAESEVELLLTPDPADELNWLVYEGSGIARNVTIGSGSQYYDDSWTMSDPYSGYDALAGMHEPISPTQQGASEEDVLRGTPPQLQDAAGRTYSFLYDEDSFVTRKTYDLDGTYESWEYDEFKQVTRYRDRLGRVTRHDYDASGNLIKTRVGLLDSGGSDVLQPGYAEYEWEYYGAGHVNEGMLKTEFDPRHNGEADLYRTDFEYDSLNRLTKRILSADSAGGSRPEITYTYDAQNRVQSETDPAGRVVAFVYDDQNRIIEKQFNDGSTEQAWFDATSGPGREKPIATKDRNNVVTEYTYDSGGRKTLIRKGVAYDVNILDGNAHDVPVTEPWKISTTSYDYSPGTERVSVEVTDGSRTEYMYDYRGRIEQIHRYPNAGKVLTETREYLDNQLFSVQNDYGCREYFGYRASDGMLIRRVVGTGPDFSMMDNFEVMNQIRDSMPNAEYIVVDAIRNEAGELTSVIDGRGFEMVKTYDSRGREVSSTEASGTSVEARTEFIYDAGNRVIEIRQPRYFDASDSEFQNATTQFAYNGRGLRSSRTAAAGTSDAATTSYQYHLDGRQSSVIDPLSHETKFYFHNCCGRFEGRENVDGHGAFSNTDFAGQVTHTAVIADYAQHSSTHSPDDGLTLGETTTRYDGLGRAIASTYWLTPLGHVDPNSVPIAGLDGVNPADGITSQRFFDTDLTDGAGLDSASGLDVPILGGGTYGLSLSACLAKLAEPTSTGGAATSFDANANGSAIVTVNAMGEVSVVIRDGLRRTVMNAVIEPNGSSQPNELITWTCYRHDDTSMGMSFGESRERQTIDAAGNIAIRRSDATGREVEIMDGAGNAGFVDFDSSGNVISFTDPNGDGFNQTVDERGRVTNRTDMTGDSVAYTYDKHSNQTSVIDGKGNPTSFLFDAHDRRIQVTDRVNGVSTMAYDLAGNQTQITDAEGSSTQYEYNARHLRTKIIHPDHLPGSVLGDPNYGVQELSYDAAGRVASALDQQGNRVDYGYDLAGRLLTKAFTAAGSGIPTDTDSFAFDNASRMISAHSERYDNTISWTHDSAGRVASESITIGGQTYAIGVSYDVRSLFTQFDLPDGSTVTRDYDENRRLIDVALDGFSVDSREYDGAGRLTMQTSGNGVMTEYYHDMDGQVQQIQTTPSGYGSPESVSYTYDANKNVTAESRMGMLSGYGWSTSGTGYDAADRLIDWSRSDGGANHSWTLTPLGDWQEATLNGSSEPRSHDVAHRLTQVGTTSLNHDSCGRMTSDHEGRGMTWDLSGQLESVTVPAGVRGDAGTHLYRYDALGRRVAKQVAGQTEVVSVHLDQQVMAEYDLGQPSSSPNLKHLYGSFIDEVILTVDETGPSPIQRWHHRNSNYSLMSMSDEMGSLVEWVSYDPYGNPTFHDGLGGTSTHSSVSDPFAFTGRTYDEETGLFYYRKRYYAPELGRFISRDPAGFRSSLSLYEYANSAPARFVDPTGESAILAGCGLGALGGAISGIFTNLPTFFANPKGACCAVGCAAAGGCIAGAIPGIAVDSGQVYLVTILGCVGGALGNLFAALCESSLCGTRGPLNACDFWMTLVNLIIGCIGGAAADLDDMAPLFIALGMNAGAWSNLCNGANGGGGGGGGGGPQLGVACCRFKNWWGTVWTEEVSCAFGRQPFGCCRDRAETFWHTWEILNVGAGNCQQQRNGF